MYNIILKQKLVILIYFSIFFFCIKIKFGIDKKENYSYNNNKTIKLGINTIGIKGGGRARITAIFLNYLYKQKLFKLYLFSICNKIKDEYPIPKDIKRIKILNNNPDYLISKIKENDIEIFIYQLSYPNEIRKLNKLKDIKVIFYIHSSIFYFIYSNNYGFYKYLYKSYTNCKFVVNLVHLENDYLFKKWNINSLFINNFVTYDYKEITPSDLSSQNIIMIGRNSKSKRFNLGIQSMKYIVSEIPNSKMSILIVHSNNILFNLINSLNLSNYIDIIENTKNPEKYLKNSSLHIFPSICESFGLVLSEAKIFGIPSIILGLDYLTLAKGGTIILYDDSPKIIAREAIKILKNTTYRIKLGKEARDSMKYFLNENTSRRWIEIILSIYKGDKYYDILRKKQSYISKNESLIIYKNQFQLFKKRIDYFHNFNFSDFDNFMNFNK